VSTFTAHADYKAKLFTVRFADKLDIASSPLRSDMTKLADRLEAVMAKAVDEFDEMEVLR
jgi:hypothetical protein